jgi:hypothetical protein
MQRVIAHEIAHRLRLSTRNDLDLGSEGDFHDPGPFPSGTTGLIRSGQRGGLGKWLRHEDWHKANDTMQEQ